MRTLIIAVLLVIFATTAFAQSMVGLNTAEMVRFAVSNVQQEGDFYFLPFPLESTYYRIFLFEAGSQTAQDAQIVITVLAEFEKQKKLDVIHFQFIKNQSAHGASSQAFGILLKAVPKKK